MPVLENPKHEVFAQKVAAGMASSRAYVSIYGGSVEVGHRRGAASELRSNSIVAARIEELQREAAKGCVVTIEQIRRGYADIAFSDLADAYDDEGELLSVPDMPANLRRALAGIDVEEIGVEGTVIGHTKKIKLSDRRAALDSLAKLDGHVAPQKIEHSGKLTYEELVAGSMGKHGEDNDND